jgi:hypothetical protein
VSELGVGGVEKLPDIGLGAENGDSHGINPFSFLAGEFL